MFFWVIKQILYQITEKICTQKNKNMSCILKCPLSKFYAEPNLICKAKDARDAKDAKDAKDAIEKWTKYDLNNLFPHFPTLLNYGLLEKGSAGKLPSLQGGVADRSGWFIS